jgi:hypothetical protein
MTPSDLREGAKRRTAQPSSARRRAPSPAVLLVVAILAAGLCVRSPVAAQEWVQPVDSLRQIQSITPRSGPPGTLVEVYSDNMPLEARFHVGVGATRSGFESLFEASQLGLGEISVRLPIPETVSRERAAVFVAFNAVFSPIAMSRPFHVTDEQGRLRRTGEVEGVGGACVVFRDEDGFLYELLGAVDGLARGSRITFEALYVGESACIDGATVRVLEVVPPDGGLTVHGLISVAGAPGRSDGAPPGIPRSPRCHPPGSDRARARGGRSPGSRSTGRRVRGRGRCPSRRTEGFHRAR